MQIAKYHADGKRVICYVNVGSFEPGRPDATAFNQSCWCGTGGNAAAGTCPDQTPSHLMNGFIEWWFDVKIGSSCLTNVQAGIEARFALAASKGCDGIEADNVDAFANTGVKESDDTTPASGSTGGGWGILAADQLSYNLWLAATAHKHGMSILLKNCDSLLKLSNYGQQLAAAFDGSLNEQCHDPDNNSCGNYQPFADAGKPLFNAEYPSTATASYCGTTLTGKGTYKGVVKMQTLQWSDSSSVALSDFIYVCP